MNPTDRFESAPDARAEGEAGEIDLVDRESVIDRDESSGVSHLAHSNLLAAALQGWLLIGQFGDRPTWKYGVPAWILGFAYVMPTFGCRVPDAGSARYGVTRRVGTCECACARGEQPNGVMGEAAAAAAACCLCSHAVPNRGWAVPFGTGPGPHAPGS